MSEEKEGGPGAEDRSDDGAAAGRGEKDSGERSGEFFTMDSEWGADKATRAAYEGGRRVLSPASIQAARDAYVHVDKRIVFGLHEVSAAPGPVPFDEITQLRRRYVPVPRHDDMRKALQEHRLVVLAGTAGSGRSTTGMALLDELTDAAIARLEPSARGLPGADQIVEGHGYLGGGERGALPSRAAADRMAADLVAANAYCVITAPRSPALGRELGFYCVDHEQADPVEILGQHVQAGVVAEDDDDLATTMAALATRPDIARLLGPAARPSEAARAAGLLLAFGRGERTWSEIEARIAQLVLDERIAEWFSVLVGVTHGQHADRARRLTAMRIAVAVFDGLPRHIAEAAAEPLAARLAMPPEAPAGLAASGQVILPRTGPRGIDPEEAATLLATTPIKVEPGEVPFGYRSVPGEVISYRDDRFPSAVLRCVWQEHYPLRGPVVAWLDDLARHDRQVVRFRAAQAAGLLCALDFTYALDVLIKPAAGAKPEVDPNLTAVATSDDEDADADADADDFDTVFARRQFAAIAMDHVARDERLRRVVRVILRRWRRNEDAALRWTAARAYAYDIGARDPEHAFEELRVLGTPWEARSYPKLKRKQRRQEAFVFHAAGETVADMFGSGAHREVLARLDEWRRDTRWSVRLLALQAVIFLMRMTASAIGTPEASGARIDPTAPNRGESLLDATDRDERAMWPILIALHGRQPELQRQAAELVRFALAGRHQSLVLRVFGDIFDIADEDEDARPAVEAFLPLVIKDESDRGRLLSLLHRMRDAWADPLSVDVATWLEKVIMGIPVVTGKKVFS